MKSVCCERYRKISIYIKSLTTIMEDTKKFLTVVYKSSRVEFLVLPVILVGTGYVAAEYTGETNIIRTILALFGLLTIHIAVNILNEVSDYRTGIDEDTEDTPFSGGSKSLINSDVSVKKVERVGQAFIIASIATGLYFVVTVGTVILPVFVIGIIIAYTYTDYLTNYSLGELGMAIGLGALPIVGTDLIQNGQVGLISTAVAIPVSLVAFNLLLMNEFPDVEADRKGGRKNLIHRFGRKNASKIYAIVAILTHISIFTIYIGIDVTWIILLSNASAVFLYKPLKWVTNQPSEKLENSVIRDNLLWNISTTVLIGLTLYIGMF